MPYIISCYLTLPPVNNQKKQTLYSYDENALPSKGMADRKHYLIVKRRYVRIYHACLTVILSDTARAVECECEGTTTAG
jgi:hypothetical protein